MLSQQTVVKLQLWYKPDIPHTTEVIRYTLSGYVIDTSAPPLSLYAQPPRVYLITSVVCGMSITYIEIVSSLLVML